MKMILFTLLILLTTVLPTTIVRAQENCPPGLTCLDNPLPSSDFRVIGGVIIQRVLAVVGSLALGMFIFGGFMWLTSAGNPEKVKKGSSAMLYAIIGLFLIFGAYAILNTIIEGLTR